MGPPAGVPMQRAREELSATSFPQVVDRTLDILHAVARRGPLTVQELQEETGLPRSSLYRLLVGLRARQLVSMDAGGWVRLGSGVLSWADGYHRQNPLALLALPAMRELTRRSEETSLLTVAVFPNGQCVQKVEPERSVRISYSVGRTRPLHAGASSKVLLAFMDPALVDLYFRTVSLDPYTRETPTSEDALRAQVGEIKKLGYCYTEGELDPGAAAIAVPIFDPAGTLVAGLSVAGPVGRLDPAVTLSHVLAAKAAIEAQLR